jgi:hypothetical protein
VIVDLEEIVTQQKDILQKIASHLAKFKANRQHPRSQEYRIWGIQALKRNSTHCRNQDQPNPGQKEVGAGESPLKAQHILHTAQEHLL